MPLANRPPSAPLLARAFAPVDIAPLVWFRVTFGALMFVEVIRYFRFGWIDRFFVQPVFLFKYFGFEWVHAFPGAGMKIHFAGLGILALCIMAGACYRLAAFLFFLGFTYVFLLEQARYLNHFYLVCLYSALLIVVPAHRAWSFDARRRPELSTSLAPAWTLWLLRAQISLVYFFGGVAKLNSDWFHGEPLRMWLAKRSGLPVIGPLLKEESVVWFFTYGGLVFDLAIVPLLLWRRTRWLAFALAVVFNLTNAVIFRIGIFPWLALGATLLLFAPRLPLPRQRHSPRPEPLVRPVARGQRLATAALLGSYGLLQCLVPLRHWIYPGDVNWTEEGHRFSWRMKLRDKAGSLAVYTHDPASGQTWRVGLSHYVNRLQLDEAAVRPDLMLQLCHRIAADYRPRYPRIQVRVRALVSLNGRPRQLLIDPDADLAAEKRTLRPALWITRLTTAEGDQGATPPSDSSDAAPGSIRD